MLKQTVVDQIEITRSGIIQIRMAKEVVDDDGTTLSSQWHRTALSPGCDIRAQMDAVSQHLTEGLGFPAVNTNDLERIKTLASAAWTDEVIAAFQAAQAAVPHEPA